MHRSSCSNVFRHFRARILYFIQRKAFPNIYPVVFRRHARRGKSKVLHGSIAAAQYFLPRCIVYRSRPCLPPIDFTTRVKRHHRWPMLSDFWTLEHRRDLSMRTQICSGRWFCSIFSIILREKKRTTLYGYFFCILQNFCRKIDFSVYDLVISKITFN